MSGSYEHEQAQLLNTAAQAVQTTVSVGTELWLSRQKPLKVQVRTASQDVDDARKALQQGTPKQEVLKSIREGDVSQRVAKSGGDPQKYSQLIWQRAEIEHAFEKSPTQATKHVKTPKKSL